MNKKNLSSSTVKPGKILRGIVLFYLIFELLGSVIGFSNVGVAMGALFALVMMVIIGVGFGLVGAKLKQSPIERVRGAEDTIREKTKAAAQQAAKRPEIRFLRGGDVEEDDFAMPSSDRCKRRREQLETLYRAGLYTREEYAAERAKLKEQ
ncbi:MAG: hypothetical protein IIW18_04945 [Oscillospiraceae bacterium]|nr:hypothetical protein [Oscillospiraceae bacterium]